MNVHAAYRRSYEQIAADHVSHWRRTGLNPWQGADALKENEDATVALIQEHTVPGRWLDVGCGMGDLLTRLQAYERHGVNISDEYLQVARERGLHVTKASAEKLPFPAGLYDLVTATDLLEHVLDLNKTVRELVRVLKPGGVLIVRTPHNEDLSQFTGAYTTYEYVHLRAFNRPTLWLLFDKVFGMGILNVFVHGDCLHGAARK